MKTTSKKVPYWSLVPKIEVSYTATVKPAGRLNISSSFSAYKVFLANWDSKTIELKEECKVLLLYGNQVQGIYEVASGGISNVSIDHRLIFMAALAAKSTGIILAHNHT